MIKHTMPGENNTNTVANIGTDIAGQMLSALVKDPVQTDVIVVDEVPLMTKIRYMKDNINGLSVAERKMIGEILVTNGKRALIRECSEGSVINLDSVPVEVVSQMYSRMVWLLRQRA